MLSEEPVPPTNVRVEREDGTVVPLELVYIGDEDGTHVWEAVLTVPILAPGDHMAMDRLPPRTAVRVPVVARPVDESLGDILGPFGGLD